VTHQLLTKPDQKRPLFQNFDCSDVFNGMVLETDTDNLDTLRQMEGVINVWQAHKVSMPEVHRSANGPSSAARNYSIHHWTGVDKLHAADIRGKGSTVAIIDTGIDYTHKAVCLSYFTLT
jgi:subtilisin family serine protease